MAQWMSDRLDRPIHLPRGWEQLRGMDFTLRRPRPAHQQADSQAQEDFKKNSQRTLKKSNKNIQRPK